MYNQNGFLLDSGFLNDGMKHGTWYMYRGNVQDIDSLLSLLKKESFTNGKREGTSINYIRDQSEAGIALYRNDILIAGHGCARGSIDGLDTLIVKQKRLRLNDRTFI